MDVFCFCINNHDSAVSRPLLLENSITPNRCEIHCVSSVCCHAAVDKVKKKSITHLCVTHITSYLYKCTVYCSACAAKVDMSTKMHLELYLQFSFNIILKFYFYVM